MTASRGRAESSPSSAEVLDQRFDVNISVPVTAAQPSSAEQRIAAIRRWTRTTVVVSQTEVLHPRADQVSRTPHDMPTRIAATHAHLLLVERQSLMLQPRCLTRLISEEPASWRRVRGNAVVADESQGGSPAHRRPHPGVQASPGVMKLTACAWGNPHRRLVTAERHYGPVLTTET